MKRKYAVGGMSCAACQASVERAVSRLCGVSEVSVSLMTASMTVEFDENTTSEADIFRAVENAGYSVMPWTKKEADPEADKKNYRTLIKRLILSAVFAIIMMYVSMGHMLSLPLPAVIDPMEDGLCTIRFAMVQLTLTIPVILLNFSYFTDGFRAAIHKNPNMNTLISLGASASFLYGIYILARMIADYRNALPLHTYAHDLYFESVTMILTLITLGRVLESRAKHHTSDAVRALMELAPKTAEVIRDGTSVVIPSDELIVGDTVVIRAGASIPCDGILRHGGGTADESVITGESIPITKDIGDTLISGTIFLTGYAEMEAVHVGDDTTVARITQLVENAASSKAPIQKLTDKISRFFVPIVCLISLVTFVLWFAVSGSLHQAVGFGISVLVISCPCSLGLATPTAIMVGIGRGASLGLLIKSADVIDVLHRADVVVFDKTGTVTEGKMKVSDLLVTDEKMAKEELLSVASSLEAMSEHPIGTAISEYAALHGAVIRPVENFTQTFGGGISGELFGNRYFAGNADYLTSVGIRIDDAVLEEMNKLSASGKTTVLLAKDGHPIGMIALADTIKDTTPEAVRHLKHLGMDIVMLTGDSEKTAHAIAREAGIEHVLSGVKPDEKASYIEKIMTGEYYGDNKRRFVVMVGDGINDAPALVMADCGIAVAHGTDIAIESASVVLVRSNPSDVAGAISLSRVIMRNITQNLCWAFGYNVLCIPIAAGVLFPAFGIALTPMIASAAMSFSSICVVGNALRLRRFRSE